MKNLLFVFFVSIFAAGSVKASNDLAGHWYDADHIGHGIQIDRDGGFGHAITWYLYRKDKSSAFLTSGQTCEEFPCIVTLHEPSARFLDGDVELGDPVGSVELTPQEDGTLEADYDLRLFLGEECKNITPGGLIFRQCVGKFDMVKLSD